MSGTLRFGLLASPFGAALAAFGGYFASAHSCDGGHPESARMLFLVIALVGLGLAAAGIASSFRAWDASTPHEPSGVTSFLARAGLLSGVVLTIGLVYLLLGPLLIHACERAW